MSQLACVMLEWSFSPPQYFEQRIGVGDAHRSIEITEGKISARIDGKHFEANASIQKTLHRELLARFQAVQMLTHQPFQLSGPSMVEVFEDGHENRVISPLTAVMAFGSAGSVSVRITTPDGRLLVRHITRSTGREEEFG